MRRGQAAALGMILCLVAGILVGILIPRGSLPWDNTWTDKLPALSVTTVPTATKDMSTQTEDTPALNPRDNAPLLEAAEQVLAAVKDSDFATFSTLIHPDLGVTFTPYSTVDTDLDLMFTRQQMKQGDSDETLYKWGFAEGSGNPISLSIENYFAEYVYNADYTQATQLAVDKVLISGNALENVAESYPGCRFVEFSFPSRDPQYNGMDWCSLKLVFAPVETDWLLVGVIHGEWTS